MDAPLVFKEMAVVIAVEKQESKLLTPEFMTHCGIVSKEWELAGQPIVSENGSLIRYTNGIAIASNPKQIQIVQPFSGNPSRVVIPKMAMRYAEIMSSLEYKAVGINYRGLVELTAVQDSPNEYIIQFLNPERVKTKPIKASLNLSYSFERNTLNLTIQDAALGNPEGVEVPPGITFMGNCETRIQLTESDSAVPIIQSVLGAWELDFAKYTTIVTDFLR